MRLSPLITSIICIQILWMGCFEMPNPYRQIPPGPWRGVLKLDPEKALIDQLPRETGVNDILDFEEVTEGDLPFNFDVVYTDDTTFHIIIRNADEEIILRDYVIRPDRATQKDTILIPFSPYDSYFEVIAEGNVLEGKWIVPSRGNYQIHFVAHHGKDYRFTQLRKPPLIDVTGRWKVLFGLETDDPFPAIGEFRQQGNYLEGTFLTETGDYRYLEGTVQADKIYLSCFDGSHMFLFEAKVQPDSSLSGIFWSGIHFITSWNAVRNETFTLTDRDSLSTVKNEEDNRLSFTFPDERGNMISLDDPVFEGKPKIIQILGTWCPNCLDETKFLLNFLDTSKIDVPVIGLAFERHRDPIRAKEAIRHYRDRLNIPYPILHAGLSDKEEASRKLPIIDEIISYPTLLFLNRENEIVKIHTGFSGPATSEYGEFMKGFTTVVHQLTEDK